jgi:hypothetical protein
VTIRRFLPADKLLSGITNGRYGLCSIEEWRYLSKTKGAELPAVSLKEWEMFDIEWEKLRLKIAAALEKMQ